MLVIGHNSVSMIVGRFLIGFYNGMCETWIFVYNAEIAPDSVRALYGAMLAISLRFGVLICYTLGIWIGYRWLANIYLINRVHNSQFAYLPESMKWLTKKGYTEEAEKTSDYFYDSHQESTHQAVHGKELDSESVRENEFPQPHFSQYSSY